MGSQNNHRTKEKMKKLKVIKIGGNIIDNEVMLNNFLQKFAQLDDPKFWFTEVETWQVN